MEEMLTRTGKQWVVPGIPRVEGLWYLFMMVRWVQQYGTLRSIAVGHPWNGGKVQPDYAVVGYGTYDTWHE